MQDRRKAALFVLPARICFLSGRAFLFLFCPAEFHNCPAQFFCPAWFFLPGKCFHLAGKYSFTCVGAFYSRMQISFQRTLPTSFLLHFQQPLFHPLTIFQIHTCMHARQHSRPHFPIDMHVTFQIHESTHAPMHVHTPILLQPAFNYNVYMMKTSQNYGGLWALDLIILKTCLSSVLEQDHFYSDNWISA